MANALSSFLSTTKVLPVISDADLGAALSDAQEAMGDTGSSSGNVFITFSGKTGQYSVGRAKAEMDPEALYVMEPSSCVAGWVCWKSSKPIDRVEWSYFKASTQKVDEADLEDHGPYNEKSGEGWSPSLGFGVCSADGAKTPLMYSTSTTSARNAIQDLINEIKARSLAGEPPIPVFKFDKESFVAQDIKNYKPKFLVEAWVNRVSVDKFFGDKIDLDALLAGVAPKRVAGKKR